MSHRTRATARRFLVLFVAAMVGGAVACADAPPTGPQAPRIRLDGTGGDTIRPPCDTANVRCYPTQPWG